MIPSTDTIKRFRKADKVPAGWFTREDCEKEWGINQTSAAKLIRIALKAGRCEMRKFTINTENRGLFPTPFYKFK